VLLRGGRDAPTAKELTSAQASRRSTRLSERPTAISTRPSQIR
jgi:hypothetical protein